MNRKSRYEKCDWTKTDTELAEKFGVSRQAIQAARKVRGIKPAQTHGGRREGAGAKPKSELENFDLTSRKSQNKKGDTSQRSGSSQQKGNR